MRYYKPLVFFAIKPRYTLTRDDTAHLGHDAEKQVRKSFSEPNLKKIRNLRNASNTTYLLVRGLPVLGFWPWRLLVRFPRDSEFPEEQKHRDWEFVQKILTSRPDDDPAEFAANSKKRLIDKRRKFDTFFRHVDFVAAGLARMLGGTIRPRYDNPDSPLARNLLTDPGEQQSSDLDNIDMALRFQQSTVEKALPKPGELTNTEETCIFRIYVCVKNLWRQPIYLLPVREIIETHLCPNALEKEKKQNVLKWLQEERFERRRPRSQEMHREQWQPGGAVLSRGRTTGDWIMSFDHERVRATNNDAAGEEALHELREAIRRGRRDAIRVPLKVGDILMVDNLRAMVSRREFYPSSLGDLFRVALSTLKTKRSTTLPSGEVLTQLRFAPFRPDRWLRSYYVFRDSETSHHAAVGAGLVITTHSEVEPSQFT